MTALKANKNMIWPRLITLIVIVAMLSQNMIWAQPAINPTEGICQSSGVSKDIYIPEQYGRITMNTEAAQTEDVSGLPLVVLIQDAHCNYEAQHNIAKIIEILRRDHGIDLIALEGGAGRLDYSIYGNVKDKNRKRKVSDKYVKNGYLSGAESFAINNYNELPVGIYGIEDTELYVKDFISFKNTFKGFDEVKVFTDELKKIIDALKQIIYGKELKLFSEESETYQLGKMQISDWIKKLLGYGSGTGITADKDNYLNILLTEEALKIEASIDFKKLEEERACLIKECEKKLPADEVKSLVRNSILFRLGKMSSVKYYSHLSQAMEILGTSYPDLEKYIKLTRLKEGINGERLLSELEIYEDQVKEKLFINNNERQLDDLNCRIKILINLFNLSLSRENLSYYENNRDTFMPNELLSFIRDQAAINNIKLSPVLRDIRLQKCLTDLISESSNFYKIALERDKALFRNTILAMNKEGKNRAIIVVGGFHKDGMIEEFKKNNVNYIIIAPNITKVEETPYLKVMLNNNIKSENSGNMLAVAKILAWGRENLELLKSTVGSNFQGILKNEAVMEYLRGEKTDLVLNEQDKAFLDKFRDELLKNMGTVNNDAIELACGILQDLISGVENRIIKEPPQESPANVGNVEPEVTSKGDDNSLILPPIFNYIFTPKVVLLIIIITFLNGLCGFSNLFLSFLPLMIIGWKTAKYYYGELPQKIIHKSWTFYLILTAASIISIMANISFIPALLLIILVYKRHWVLGVIVKLFFGIKNRIKRIPDIFERTKPGQIVEDVSEKDLLDIEHELDERIANTSPEESIIDEIMRLDMIGTKNSSGAFFLGQTGVFAPVLGIKEENIETPLEMFKGRNALRIKDKTKFCVKDAHYSEGYLLDSLLVFESENGQALQLPFHEELMDFVFVKDPDKGLTADNIDYQAEIVKAMSIKAYLEDKIKDSQNIRPEDLQAECEKLKKYIEALRIAYFLNESSPKGFKFNSETSYTDETGKEVFFRRVTGMDTVETGDGYIDFNFILEGTYKDYHLPITRENFEKISFPKNNSSYAGEQSLIDSHTFELDIEKVAFIKELIRIELEGIQNSSELKPIIEELHKLEDIALTLYLKEMIFNGMAEYFDIRPATPICGISAEGYYFKIDYKDGATDILALWNLAERLVNAYPNITGKKKKLAEEFLASFSEFRLGGFINHIKERYKILKQSEFIQYLLPTSDLAILYTQTSEIKRTHDEIMGQLYSVIRERLGEQGIDTFLRKMEEKSKKLKELEENIAEQERLAKHLETAYVGLVDTGKDTAGLLRKMKEISSKLDKLKKEYKDISKEYSEMRSRYKTDYGKIMQVQELIALKEKDELGKLEALKDRINDIIVADRMAEEKSIIFGNNRPIIELDRKLSDGDEIPENIKEQKRLVNKRLAVLSRYMDELSQKTISLQEELHFGEQRDGLGEKINQIRQRMDILKILIEDLERYRETLDNPGSLEAISSFLRQSKALKWGALASYSLAGIGASIGELNNITKVYDQYGNEYFFKIAKDTAGKIVETANDAYQYTNELPRYILFWTPYFKMLLKFLPTAFQEIMSEISLMLFNSEWRGHSPTTDPEDKDQDHDKDKTKILAELEKPGGYYRLEALSKINGSKIDPENLPFGDAPLGEKTGKDNTITMKFKGNQLKLYRDYRSTIDIDSVQVQQEGKNLAFELQTNSYGDVIVVVKSGILDFLKQKQVSYKISYREPVSNFIPSTQFIAHYTQLPPNEAPPPALKERLDQMKGLSYEQKRSAAEIIINERFEYSTDSDAAKMFSIPSRNWLQYAFRDGYEKEEKLKADCDVLAFYGLLILRYLGIPARFSTGAVDQDVDGKLRTSELHGIAEAMNPEAGGAWEEIDFTQVVNNADKELKLQEEQKELRQEADNIRDNVNQMLEREKQIEDKMKELEDKIKQAQGGEKEQFRAEKMKLEEELKQLREEMSRAANPEPYAPLHDILQNHEEESGTDPFPLTHLVKRINPEEGTKILDEAIKIYEDRDKVIDARVLLDIGGAAYALSERYPAGENRMFVKVYARLGLMTAQKLTDEKVVDLDKAGTFKEKLLQEERVKQGFGEKHKSVLDKIEYLSKKYPLLNFEQLKYKYEDDISRSYEDADIYLSALPKLEERLRSIQKKYPFSFKALVSNLRITDLFYMLGIGQNILVPNNQFYTYVCHTGSYEWHKVLHREGELGFMSRETYDLQVGDSYNDVLRDDFNRFLQDYIAYVDTGSVSDGEKKEERQKFFDENVFGIRPIDPGTTKAMMELQERYPEIRFVFQYVNVIPQDEDDLREIIAEAIDMGLHRIQDGNPDLYKRMYDKKTAISIKKETEWWIKLDKEDGSEASLNHVSYVVRQQASAESIANGLIDTLQNMFPQKAQQTEENKEEMPAITGQEGENVEDMGKVDEGTKSVIHDILKQLIMYSPFLNDDELRREFFVKFRTMLLATNAKEAAVLLYILMREAAKPSTTAKARREIKEFSLGVIEELKEKYFTERGDRSIETFSSFYFAYMNTPEFLSKMAQDAFLYNFNEIKKTVELNHFSIALDLFSRAIVMQDRFTDDAFLAFIEKFIEFIQANPDIYSKLDDGQRNSIGIERFDTTILFKEDFHARSVVDFGDSAKVNDLYNTYRNRYLGCLEKAGPQRAQYPLSVLRMDTRYLSQGAENLLNLLDSMTSKERDEKFGILLEDAFMAQSRGFRSDEERVFYTIIMAGSLKFVKNANQIQRIELFIAQTFASLPLNTKFLVFKHILRYGSKGLKDRLFSATMGDFRGKTKEEIEKALRESGMLEIFSIYMVLTWNEFIETDLALLKKVLPIALDFVLQGMNFNIDETDALDKNLNTAGISIKDLAVSLIRMAVSGVDLGVDPLNILGSLSPTLIYLEQSSVTNTGGETIYHRRPGEVVFEESINQYQTLTRDIEVLKAINQSDISPEEKDEINKHVEKIDYIQTRVFPLFHYPIGEMIWRITIWQMHGINSKRSAEETYKEVKSILEDSKLNYSELSPSEFLWAFERDLKNIEYESTRIILGKVINNYLLGYMGTLLPKADVKLIQDILKGEGIMLGSFQEHAANLLRQNMWGVVAAADMKTGGEDVENALNAIKKTLEILKALSVRKEDIKQERGYEGKPNIWYTAGIREALLQKNFGCVRYDGERVLNSNLTDDAGEIIEPNVKLDQGQTNRLNKVIKELAAKYNIDKEQLQEVFLVFIKGQSSHYGVSRPQVYLDIELLNKEDISELKYQLHHELQERAAVISALNKRYPDWKQILKRPANNPERQRLEKFINKTAKKNHNRLVLEELADLLNISSSKELKDILGKDYNELVRNLIAMLKKDGVITEEELGEIEKSAVQVTDAFNLAGKDLPLGIASNVGKIKKGLAVYIIIQNLEKKDKARSLPVFMQELENELKECAARKGIDADMITGLIKDIHQADGYYIDGDEIKISPYFELMIDWVRVFFGNKENSNLNNLLEKLNKYKYAKALIKNRLKTEKTLDTKSGSEIYEVVIGYKSKGKAERVKERLVEIMARYVVDKEEEVLVWFERGDRKREIVEKGLENILRSKGLHDIKEPALENGRFSGISSIKNAIKQSERILDIETKGSGIQSQWQEDAELRVEAELLVGNNVYRTGDGKYLSNPIGEGALWLLNIAKNNLIILFKTEDEKNAVKGWLIEHGIDADKVRFITKSEYPMTEDGRIVVSMLSDRTSSELQIPKGHRVIKGAKNGENDIILMSRMAGILGSSRNLVEDKQNIVSRFRMLYQAYYKGALSNEEIEKMIELTEQGIREEIAIILELPPISPFVKIYYEILKTTNETTAYSA